MTQEIHCTCPPFLVPHFVIPEIVGDDAISYLEFPRKWDFIVADIDGDGTISEADRERWKSPDDVLLRLAALDQKSGDVKLEIWEQDWWHNGLDVYCTIDDQDKQLTWNDEWELQLTLPPEYIELEIQLLYLGLNLNRFAQIYTDTESQIDAVYDELENNTMELFKQSAKWLTLRKRLSHLENTYVRL